MGYFDKKNKFAAIDADKKHIQEAKSKTEQANTIYGNEEKGTMEKAPKVEKEIVEVEIEKVPEIALKEIQPRKINDFSSIGVMTLKASILSTRLMDPITLRDDKNGKYTIISGHRRFKAYEEIIKDLHVEKAKAEKQGLNTEDIDTKIAKYSKIPAIIYEVVSDSSPLLGTDPKYITDAQEDAMYRAGNLENRQITQNELFRHIVYFYNLIKNNQALYTELLDKRNANAARKATKLNVPETLKELLTTELGFTANGTHIWRIVTILDDVNPEHSTIRKISLDKINNNEPVKPVFNTFMDYIAICDDKENENADVRTAYLKKIEAGKDSKVYYNEYFNVKVKNKPAKEEVVTEVTTVDKDKVLKILKSLKSNKITVDEAILKIEKL